MSAEHKSRVGFAGKVLFTALTIAGVGSAIDCGGGNDASPSTSTGIETKAPTETPDAVTTAPTDAPTQEITPKPELKKLSDAEFAPAKIEDVVAALDAAPFDTSGLTTDDGTAITRKLFDNAINLAQFGNPDDIGKPNAIAFDRMLVIAGISGISLKAYEKTGDERFYTAGVRGAEYLATELPELEDDFVIALKQFYGIEDTLPQEK